MRPTRKQVLDAAARLSEADRRAKLPGYEWAIAANGGYGKSKQVTVLSDIRTLVDHALENVSDYEGFDAA